MERLIHRLHARGEMYFAEEATYHPAIPALSSLTLVATLLPPLLEKEAVRVASIAILPCMHAWKAGAPSGDPNPGFAVIQLGPVDLPPPGPAAGQRTLCGRSFVWFAPLALRRLRLSLEDSGLVDADVRDGLCAALPRPHRGQRSSRCSCGERPACPSQCAEMIHLKCLDFWLGSNSITDRGLASLCATQGPHQAWNGTSRRVLLTFFCMCQPCVGAGRLLHSDPGRATWSSCKETRASRMRWSQDSRFTYAACNGRARQAYTS